jgi:hypothetical protein
MKWAGATLFEKKFEARLAGNLMPFEVRDASSNASALTSMNSCSYQDEASIKPLTIYPLLTGCRRIILRILNEDWRNDMRNLRPVFTGMALAIAGIMTFSMADTALA